MTLGSPTTVRFAAGTRRLSDHVLIGGAPTRLVGLTPRAASVLVDDRFELDDGDAGALGAHLLDSGVLAPDLGSLPEISTDRLTVVIPAYRRSAALARLLDSLRGVKVIVVDDGSPEPVVAPGAQVLRLRTNSGPAAARNAGLAAATTEFVAFCDSDVVASVDVLARLLRHFADPDVAIVAPRIRGLERDGGWITRYENACSSLDRGPDAALVRPHSRVSWVPGACLLARVSALGTGFRPELRAGEDVDLIWRSVAAGWLVRYEPDCIVQHEHRTAVGRWLRRKFVYGTSAHDLAVAHGSAVAPAVLSRAQAGVLVALVFQRRWSLPVATSLLAYQVFSTRKQLAERELPTQLAPELVALGAVEALKQGSALLLRHWWPVLALSSRLRRAALIAAAVDSVIVRKRSEADLDLARFFVARRIDDLAYGAGVWWGALVGRSPVALLPSLFRRQT